MTDVAIVGAGPVGLVLAILLGQRGRSVVVLEQWPEPYPLPRAVHFDHEVGRIIQACGIGDEVRAVSEPAEVYEWRNGEGTTLLRFGRIGMAASGWPFSSMFCQPEFEAVLRARAESLPTVEVRRGTKVHGLTPADDHVLVEHGSGDALRAGYVVGCDGANSTVRDLLGVAVDDRGFHYDWLIVDLVLDAPRVFDPINVQVCDPERPTTAVSGGPGRRRWEFMRLPTETLEDLGREERAWELLAPWDVHPGNARLERHAVYTFEARVAEQWQAGRVLLAGDAAHLMPPFAGQGMCSGIRDAVNLAWKLDLVLDGRADAALLATYDEERRPNANAAVDLSIELGQVICVPDPAEAAARDEAMTAGYDGSVSDVPGLPGITRGIVAAGTPQAGELFPQADLRPRGARHLVGSRLFDDVHGAGWRLVTAAADPAPLDPELVEWFAGIGGTVVAAPEMDDWFTRHDVRWALQRPDFHLFGTATDTADPLLADLRQQIRRPR
ncbi:MAG TPA: bifunctional 3-(3-hydroxy-phenyl)propionate/3-hydroxycinnamic acid hydroxylase [Iamia sp.]|nr:bifunctional 3-(3-hydroxy-phenyl)propionate/3-hydroxycinnamic acid hydroxylase [Iamia sp.]